MHEISPKAPSLMNMLVLTPDQEVNSAVCRVLQHSNWRVLHASTLADALAQLKDDIAVVLCAPRLVDGTWRDALKAISSHGSRAPLVVVDRQASNELWSEVLNKGGYDVLSFPVDAHELFRVATQAWRCWRRRGDEGSKSEAGAAATA